MERMNLQYAPFQNAKAIWAEGRQKEVNCTCRFSVHFPRLRKGKLIITASSLYRAFLNGKLIAYGPARAAHGYFRVDEIKLACEDMNTLEVEVAGYNCNSFYLANQASFLIAEVMDGERSVLWTGRNFDCILYRQRLQKVPRFSFQRCFMECYDFIGAKNEKTRVQTVECGKFLPRNVAYYPLDYEAFSFFERGRFTEGEGSFPRDRYLTNKELVIFPEEEWECNPLDRAYRLRYKKEKGNSHSLRAGEYAVYAYERSLTGFLETELYAEEDSTVYLLFDELNLNEEGDAEEADICFWRNDSVNLIPYEIKKGEFRHLSFEAYTAKFVKLVVFRGSVRVGGIGIRKYENTLVKRLRFACADEKINTIVEAARNTLAQNAVDILTDCPSRERAGWLCDSYFSGPAETLFSGENCVEHNFLENYANQSGEIFHEDGVLAMCYPADFPTLQFIPNWMMFYLLQLQDYYYRTGDGKLIADSRERALGVIKYFEKFENEYGLLEDLPSWVFIEWSMAGEPEYTKGVSFPSNMLYCNALQAFGELYEEESYIQKAERLKETICKFSFNGQLFEDNFVRVGDALTSLGHTSETCQYYAFYFRVADRVRYPELYRFMLEELGPARDRRTHTNVPPSNAFIGHILRLDYILQQGQGNRFLEECKAYYYKMAKSTGTLWEHDMAKCSLNHGFASYIANMIVTALSGLCDIDKVNKVINLCPSECTVDYDISIPVDDDFIRLSFKNGERTISVPQGYTVKIKDVIFCFHPPVHLEERQKEYTAL